MSLVKNSIYNIAGFAVPTLIAIPALGWLARQLGVESFGLFTLAFAIVGYASIFDGGITRAVIREVSIFRNDLSEQCKILSTANVVVLVLGCVGSLLLYFCANNLVNLLKITYENSIQARLSFELLASIIPVFLINQVWLAYLEGHEKFANLNIQKVISSSLIAILPAIFCWYKPSLVYAILGLVFGRYLSLAITFFVCKKMIIQSGIGFNVIVFKRLMAFGGWLTVSNIISPIMVYFDRFVISNIMGASRIAFYTAPAEAVSRLINIPYALSRALFPKLSHSNDLDEKKKLENQSYLLISLVCLPIVIIGCFLAEFILSTWLGSNYAGLAVQVFQILLVGFYFNALAQIPFSILQADGKSKVTALIHVFEIIPYLAILFYLTYEFGIVGTAIAWSLRTFVDLILMFILSRKK